MKKEILIVCAIPHVNDATSFYRAAGPLAHLRKNSDINVSITLVEKAEWSLFNFADVIFFQRPFTDEHKRAMQLAVDLKIPIWTDYDDNLLAVPFDNPTCVTYNKDHIQNNIKEMMGMSTVVTVSNGFLKQRYKEFSKNILVIENALDLSIFPNYNFDKKERLKTIAWRGSPTHHRDVMSVANEILQVNQEHEDYTFEFMGDRLWFLSERLRHGSLKLSGPFDVMTYFKYIQDNPFRAFIVPLVRSEFNMSKSNIAWMESSLCGALTVAPNMPEWVQPGVLNYETTKEFKACVKQAIEMDADEYSMRVANSWEKITEVYSLDVQNKKRLSMLKDLVS
jgi:hypothetical protein